MYKVVRLFAALAVLAFVGSSVLAADDDAKEKRKGRDPSAALGKLFDQMDADGDGKVTREEFNKFFEGRAAGRGLGEVFKGLFDKLDTDKDGKLTKEEFGKFRETLGGGLGGRGDLKDRLEKLKDKGNLKEKLEELKKLREKFRRGDD